MSIRWIERAFVTPCQSPAEKLLLLALADYASKDTAAVFPKVQSLADKTGLTRRSVQLLLRKLERRKLLKRDGFTPGGVARYRLMLGPLGVVPARKDEQPEASGRPEKKAKPRTTAKPATRTAAPAEAGPPEPATAPSPPPPMPAPLALPAAAPETSRWDFLRLFQALGYSFQKNRDGAAAEKLAQKRPQDVRAALLLGHARKRRGGKDMPRSLAYFLPIVAEVETDNPEGVDLGYLEYLERWVSAWEPFFRHREQEPSEELALAS